PRARSVAKTRERTGHYSRMSVRGDTDRDRYGDASGRHQREDIVRALHVRLGRRQRDRRNRVVVSEVIYGEANPGVRESRRTPHRIVQKQIGDVVGGDRDRLVGRTVVIKHVADPLTKEAEVPSAAVIREADRLRVTWSV